MKPTHWLSLVFFLSALLIAGCEKSEDQISTYEVPREQKSKLPEDLAAPAPAIPEQPAMGDKTTSSQSGAVKWQTPPNWEAQPASSMRLGGFTYTGESGQAEVSVVALPGDGGGLLPNINRWRGQLELPPLDKSELDRAVQKVPVSGQSMLMVEFVSDQDLIEDAFKKRLVVMIHQTENQTYFFKMVGEDQAVNENGEAFLEFMDSLEFSGS